jgi:rubrerythrin
MNRSYFFTVFLATEQAGNHVSRYSGKKTWREPMGQPVDIYLWPIFQTIKEEIDDLQKLLNAEKRHTYGELERLMKRILEIERQHAKRKEG